MFKLTTKQIRIKGKESFMNKRRVTDVFTINHKHVNSIVTPSFFDTVIEEFGVVITILDPFKFYLLLNVRSIISFDLPVSLGHKRFRINMQYIS